MHICKLNSNIELFISVPSLLDWLFNGDIKCKGVSDILCFFLLLNLDIIIQGRKNYNI
jgi:hypothetical protein